MSNLFETFQIRAETLDWDQLNDDSAATFNRFLSAF